MMDLRASLNNYHSQYKEELISKIKMLEFFNNYENQKNSIFCRKLQVGHFTASAFLFNNDKTKFLLMHHTKLDKWLQLGGHCDGDSNVLAVAIREAQEESGIADIQPISSQIFDIDVHFIPGNITEPFHYHYDVRFLLKTVNNDSFTINSEAKELKWFELIAEIPASMMIDGSVIRMIEKAVAFNRHLSVNSI